MFLPIFRPPYLRQFIEFVEINKSKIVAYAPTEANPKAELKEVFWKKLGHLVKQIPTKELVFVLIDAEHGLEREWKGAMTVGCLEHTDVMS